MPYYPPCTSDTFKLYGSENYADWAVRTQSKLHTLGLWGHIDGTCEDPGIHSRSVGTDDIKHAVEYNEKEQAARRYIISQVSDSCYDTVIYKQAVSALSAKMLWDALRHRYQERGDELRYDVFLELTNTRWSGTNLLEDHVEHLTRMMKRLNDITTADGLECMPEWTQISMLLQSIDGVDEDVQRSVVDVLKSADLRKKKFVEIAQDLMENSHMKRMLEIGRMEMTDEDVLDGWVETTG
jgi:hypothetical protein